MSRPDNKARVLAAMPGTVIGLMRKTGLRSSAVHAWVKALREEGQSHIGKWGRTKGRYRPCHHAGPGIDAKEPVKRGGAEYFKKAYHRRRKAKLELAGSFDQARAAGIAAAEQTARQGDPVIGDLMAALCRPVREARP